MKAVILHNASVLLISGFEVPKGHQSCRGVVKPHHRKITKEIRNCNLQFLFFAPPHLIKLTLIEANCFLFFQVLLDVPLVLLATQH